MALCVVRKLPEDKKQRPLQNGDFLKETLIDLFLLGFWHFYNMFGQPIQPVAELRTSEETSHRCQSPTLNLSRIVTVSLNHLIALSVFVFV